MSYFNPPNVSAPVQSGYPMTPQGKQNIIKRIVVCCDGYVILSMLTLILPFQAKF
jgi:hypothetical protein